MYGWDPLDENARQNTSCITKLYVHDAISLCGVVGHLEIVYIILLQEIRPLATRRR